MKIENELDGPNGQAILAINATERWQWIRLIKKLGYEPEAFDRAAILLSRFVAVEPSGHKNNSAVEPFSELFQLHLSGTKASPQQRREFVIRLAQSTDPAQHHCACIALDALLKVHHFSSTNTFDFGARSRDWGWRPATKGDVCNWYNTAITLTINLSPNIENSRNILGRKVRELWLIDSCHDTLDYAAITLLNTGPWVEGWLGFRTSLRFDSKGMSEEVRERLQRIIYHLKPRDLLHQARAIVIDRSHSGWDIADGVLDTEDGMEPWERASKMAQHIGYLLAQDIDTRSVFLKELLSKNNQQRSFECGRGLAEGANELSQMWSELVHYLSLIDPSKRNLAVIGGFFYQAYQCDREFTLLSLENIVDNKYLRSCLPYLQAQVGINKDGIERLRRAIKKNALNAADFYSIAYGIVADSPAEDLSALLLDIGELSGGIDIALDILHMHLYKDIKSNFTWDRSVIEAGRYLLTHMELTKSSSNHDFHVETVIRVCCADSDGESTAEKICKNLLIAIEKFMVSPHETNHILKSLFEVQPFIALDIFLLNATDVFTSGMFEVDSVFGNPLRNITSATLRQWADVDSTTRYPLLGQSTPMFKQDNGEESNELAPQFLELLEYAPDKYAFLGDFYLRLHPGSWCGSLADILLQRRIQVLKFFESPYSDVRRWANEIIPKIDDWIDTERERDRRQEASFE